MSRNILTGLVGAWCPSLGPSGFTLLDRSGRGTHGTLTNMDAGAWKGSPGGWALDFDGTNDYVPLTARNWLSLVSPSQLITISAWVLFRSTSRQSLFADWNNTGNGESLRFEMSGYNITSGYVGGNIFRAGGQSPIQTPSSVALNQWHHFVVQRAPAGERLFWNGPLVASNSSVASALTSTNQATIGRAGEYAAFYCNALVGDIGLWSRDITEAEAMTIYNLGRGGLGRLLTQRAQRRAFRTQAAAVKSYLFVNRGQVIGGGTL